MRNLPHDNRTLSETFVHASMPVAHCRRHLRALPLLGGRFFKSLKTNVESKYKKKEGITTFMWINLIKFALAVTYT